MCLYADNSASALISGRIYVISFDVVQPRAICNKMNLWLDDSRLENNCCFRFVHETLFCSLEKIEPNNRRRET